MTSQQLNVKNAIVYLTKQDAGQILLSREIALNERNLMIEYIVQQGKCPIPDNLKNNNNTSIAGAKEWCAAYEACVRDQIVCSDCDKCMNCWKAWAKVTVREALRQPRPLELSAEENEEQKENTDVK